MRRLRSAWEVFTFHLWKPPHCLCVSALSLWLLGLFYALSLLVTSNPNAPVRLFLHYLNRLPHMIFNWSLLLQIYIQTEHVFPLFPKSRKFAGLFSCSFISSLGLFLLLQEMSVNHIRTLDSFLHKHKFIRIYTVQTYMIFMLKSVHKLIFSNKSVIESTSTEF